MLFISFVRKPRVPLDFPKDESALSYWHNFNKKKHSRDLFYAEISSSDGGKKLSLISPLKIIA